MERRPDPHVCVELFPVLPSLLRARAVKDACVSPRCDRHHLQGWVSAGRLRRTGNALWTDIGAGTQGADSLCWDAVTECWSLGCSPLP